MVGTFGFFVFSHPSVPATTLGELIAYAKANPGKLNYGTGNSTSQLATAQLALLQKLEMVHVPYKGDGPLSTDLLGGRVHFSIATPGIAAPQVREGRLRVLATLLPNRSPLLPEAPTLEEAGVTGLTVAAWGALFGPAKMPREVVDRVAREMAIVLARPEVRDAFAKIAFEGQSSTPEALGAHLKAQVDVWKRTVQQVGIKPE
jgi:tripartite-type tricarboxylate transporter receptor subunit TctC